MTRTSWLFKTLGMILSLACAADALAQAVPLPGVITVHNSRYKTGKTVYVQGGLVRAEQAKPVVSDANGRFTLEVVGRPTGSGLALKVEHAKLVVLDPHALEQVVLGSSEPLVIHMTDPEELDAERIKYHGIATDAIEMGFKERMRRLRDSTVVLRTRLDEMAREFGVDSISLTDAIGQLVGQRQEALAEVDHIAERFVQADLDAASDRFRQAFQAFTSGKIDEALNLLDQKELDREQNRAVEQRKVGEEMITKANKVIIELRQCYRLKSDVLQATMRRREAIEVMRTDLAMVEENPDLFPPRELVRTTILLADLERVQGLSGIVRGRVRKVLALDWMNDPAAAEQRIEALSLIGRLYLNVNDLDSAQIIEKEVLRAALSADPPAWKACGEAHNVIGETFRLRSELDLALTHLDSASMYLDKAGVTTDPVRSAVQHSIALVSIYQNDHKRAVDLLRECLRTEQAREYPDHLMLSVYMGDLSYVYSRTGPLDSALALQRRSLVISRGLFGPSHPAVNSVEASMAFSYELMDMSDSALALMDRSLAGYLRWSSVDRQEYAMNLKGLADCQAKLDMPEEALENARKAMAIIDEQYRYQRLGRAASMITMAEAFWVMGQLDSAAICIQSGVDSLQAFLGTLRHPNVSGALTTRAHILLDREETAPALDDLQAAYQLRMMIFGPGHWKLAGNAINLGEAYRLAGLPDSAIHYLEIAQGIAADPTVAFSTRSRLYDELALYHEWFVDPSLAIRYADTALAMCARMPPGRAHALALRNSHAVMGRTLISDQRHEEAIQHFRAVLATTRCARCLPDHQETQSRALLGGALLHLGRSDSARVVIAEAVRHAGDADALWSDHLLNEKSRGANENVDALLRCWKLRQKDLHSSPAQKRATWDALVLAAASAGRSQELKDLGPDMNQR